MFEEIIRYVDETTTLETLMFAKTLGMKKILLLFSKHKEENKQVTEALAKKTGLQILLALEVPAQQAQKYAQKYEELFAMAQRENIENTIIQNLYGAEELDEKDRTHQRGSGLNHVLAKILFEKKKIYYFDLHTLLLEKDKAKLLGRMQQNKRFFDKYKVSYQLHSFAEHWNDLRTVKDRKHFLNNM